MMQKNYTKHLIIEIGKMQHKSHVIKSMIFVSFSYSFLFVFAKS